MNVKKLYYHVIDEKGQRVCTWHSELIDSIDENKYAKDIDAMRSILTALRGYTIIEATSLLRKCEHALQQAVFDDEIK